MKTFKNYLTEALKSTMKFGGERFKMAGITNYELQGKYKGALNISFDEEEKYAELSMNIGSDKLEDWIDDTRKKVGEKKWPEDSEGEEQEKYFDNKIIKKIWDDAEKQFKKLGYKVEYGD